MDQDQKTTKVKYVSFLLVTLAVFSVSSGLMDKEEDDMTDENNFALIELFTSQGCSSCPAADKLLSEFVAKEDDKIYGLSFHVSYWNHLGWKDPYSKKEFTERQRQYARTFSNSNIYTPQMVVNGTHEFVGSNRLKAEKAIAQAFDEAYTHKINLNRVVMDRKVEVTYKINGPLKERHLHFAIVEKDLKNRVSRGENRDRLLHHDNVVRYFKTLPAEESGLISLPLPPGLDPDNSAVIAYVQHQHTMKITGAARVLL